MQSSRWRYSTRNEISHRRLYATKNVHGTSSMTMQPAGIHACATCAFCVHLVRLFRLKRPGAKVQQQDSRLCSQKVSWFSHETTNKSVEQSLRRAKFLPSSASLKAMKLKGHEVWIIKFEARCGWNTAHTTLATCLKPHPLLSNIREHYSWEEQRNDRLASLAARNEEVNYSLG